MRTQEACHPIGQAPDPIRPASLLDYVPHYVEVGHRRWRLGGVMVVNSGRPGLAAAG